MAVAATGREQTGQEDIGVQDDPHRVRWLRVASISALMSCSDSRSVPAFTEACCMAVAAAWARARRRALSDSSRLSPDVAEAEQ